MADINILMFLENLKRLMSPGLHFLASQNDELQCLYENTSQMSTLLKSVKEDGSADKVNKLTMEIKALVFEAENIIDSGTTGGSGDYDFSTKLKSIRKEMEAIITTYKDGRSELEWWGSQADTTAHLVRLRPQVHKLIHRFKDGKPLEIISIVGLPGIGKTTLAKEIYNDGRTREKFEIRAWIKVAQDGYRKRDLLTGILESISKQEMETEEELLGNQLFEQFLDRKYLIVVDDIWDAQTLFDLRAYLPDQCNGSKIIVTTCESMVAKAIQDYFESCVNRVDPLSEEDSWELFKRKMLGNQTTFSKEVEELGMMMVKQCHGLPLAIAGLCEVLAWKDEAPRLWSSTANTLATFLKGYVEENLICRYEQLPPHLKACLLYIGSFPEHYHIPVRDLVLLLVAEGIVVEATGDGHNNGNIAPILPKVVAEGYISDLVDTCLVMVSSKSICGATKTCRIFGLVREFCSVTGEEGKFAYQALLHSDQTSSVSVSQNDPRRLFISHRAYTEISLQHGAPSLRSILCFDVDKDAYWMDRNWPFHADEFKLLKVLDLLPILTDFYWEIRVMVHLTYLAVRCKDLPESITNLFNLETLILYNPRVIYLPPGTLKMVKLRHVRNKTGVLCFASSLFNANPGIVENLQTVYPLCHCETCRLIFAKCPRLRELGLFHSLRSGFHFLPENLSVLQHLETLKCSYRNNSSYFLYHKSNTKFIPVWHSNFKLKLAGSIKSLTLKWTFLRWEMISVLGTLPNLEVLKLLDEAFCEKSSNEPCWDTSEQEFLRLKCLKMRNLDIIKWVDNHVGFKSLEILLIFGCQRLKMLPSGLARAPRLHTLQVVSCNTLLENSVKSYCNGAN